MSASWNNDNNVVVTYDGKFTYITPVTPGWKITIEFVGGTPYPNDDLQLYINDDSVPSLPHTEAAEYPDIYIETNYSSLEPTVLRYTVEQEGGMAEVENIYEQQAIVPAAVSSQLDVTGEERIHIAPYEEKDSTPPPPPPAGDCLSLDVYQYGDAEFNSISEWISDALPEATFRHLIITNAPTLEEALLLDYWFIVLEISREGPDFYAWYVNDLDGPFANYGDPPNYVEANGFLAILASEEGIQPITLAQGCVHANLFGGAI